MAKKIDYYLVSFCDLFGVVRSKLVPSAAIAAMQKDGAGFAGFATYLDLTPADADMFAIPDMDRQIILPWKPNVAWLPADVYIGGAPVEHGPRFMLKRLLADAKKSGFYPKTGVECEYFLLSEDASELADSADTAAKPCYDQQALMRRYDLITEVCDYMQALGWGPYQNDHEDANGQFEMNWHYGDALETADRHVFFKYMVKTVAEKQGMRATFMPKPFAHTTGNGAHIHVSLWDKAGKKNLMHDKKGELGLSQTAYYFIGGVLHEAQALTAMVAPTVNSYRRLHAIITDSGATWAPNTITYGGNNRTHLIRIPDDDRIEIRFADGSTNPYLLQAAFIAAGLKGIAEGRDPGKRLDINMYTEGHKLGNVPRLPDNLGDALHAFDKSKSIETMFGAEFKTAYSKLKHAEWQEFLRHFSTWERTNALDV